MNTYKDSWPKLQTFSRGFVWLDTGTHEALSKATEFVKTVEKRISLKIAYIEEIALKMKFIDSNQFVNLIAEQGESTYSLYLKRIII